MGNNTLNAVICCIGENKQDYFIKLKNLFLSIDRLGGEISKLDRVVFFMEAPKVKYKKELEKMDVRVINSTPVNIKYPHNNKARMLELDLGYNLYILLDHDTIVCDDFSKFLNNNTFQAKPVDWSGPKLEFWKKIFNVFNLKLPVERYTSTKDGKKIIPYFNSGVLLVPGSYRKNLYDAWIYYIHELISIKEQLDNFTFFIDQIALTLALQKTNINITPLPIEMNFHIHRPVNKMFCPEKSQPYIIHYHSCIDKSGYLNSSKYPRVHKKIKKFNEILKEYEFNNKSFWDERYSNNSQLGSGIGSRGENLLYKRQLLNQMIDGLEIESILDIGCGDQFVTIELPDDKYIGVDLSSVVIEKNRKKNPNRTFVNADFLKTDFSPVDMTICFDVVIHLKNSNKYKTFVKRIVNTTKKYGIISGYEDDPTFQSEITFYHEPLSSTLRCAGAKNLRLLGKYRNTCVWYFDKNDSVYEKNTHRTTKNTIKKLEKPTFIVGCMRSGTTLLAKLLGKHREIVYCPFELRHIWSKVGGVPMASPKTNDHNCPNLTAHDVQVGQAERLTEAFYAKFERELKNKSLESRFLSKNPHLCNKLSFVNELFPDSRYIWIYRDLMQVVTSLKKLFLNAYIKKKTWHYWPTKKNDKTVRCWSCYFDDELPEKIDKSRCFPGGDIKYLAEYWYESNKAAVAFSRTVSDKRFLAIGEEELIKKTRLILAKCYSFLEVPLEIPSGLNIIDPKRNEVWINLLNKNELRTLLHFIIEYDKKFDDIFYEKGISNSYRKQLLELV